jgi:hypothetical protein
MKHLIVIGDSFCAKRGDSYPNSWVTKLGEYTGREVHGIGIPGESWWKQHVWFANNLKNLPPPEDTVIVWSHTSAHRIPCEIDARVNPWVVRIDKHTDASNDIEAKHDPDGKLFHLARDFYQSPLYVEKFYAWAMVAWWKELAITLAPYKKVIHMFGFHDYCVSDQDRLVLLAPNSIVVTEPSLGGISKCDSTSFAGGVGDTRMNHLSEHNNNQLALFLKDVVDNTPTNSTIKIDNFDQWKFEIPYNANYPLWKFYGYFIKNLSKSQIKK